MNTNSVQALEGQLERNKELIDRRNLALRLSNNRDFKKLIIDDFCLKEAARLVGESADPALDQQQRMDALSMAQAGGHLRRFLSMAFQMGAVAERDISEIEEALAEARAEEDAPQGDDNIQDEE